ncbi:DEAD/DEAH box helicase [Nodosilinea sp. FACHB-13]|nr:DEAD/DEAH box helicase [Nodosilinea sp. FACHB-13]
MASSESFALCTPTGSGKTAVAELAILQSLFISSGEQGSPSNISNPLAIYLVPSRALATEVESTLARALHFSSNEQIKVTGLYGGTDWGPTDAWLTASERVVLICTYEKAEALFRFLGVLFIHRVRLVVIDEAHAVQFDGNNDSLRSSENRSLRLESLGTRLLTYLNQDYCRMVALSAVAAGAESQMARWISRQPDATPAKTFYRSTRQLIGRLECFENRKFRIYYDLLDGADLGFRETDQPPDRPYILDAFEPFPRPVGSWNGVEKSLRPYLFWAAINLAKVDSEGKRKTVLIAVPQQPGGYADDFLNLLERSWNQVPRPDFFEEPSDPIKLRLWQRCLRSCEDYFGRGSREFRLLEQGIVVHHGQMPGLMARLLLELIQEKVVQIVLATSTLSEGVNLPFELILIPSLFRGQHRISTREFRNLVGRAGRPGSGTEGRSLMVLSPEQLPMPRRRRNRQNVAYDDLISEIRGQNIPDDSNSDAKSPLSELLYLLRDQWRNISESTSADAFLDWLEHTRPIDFSTLSGASIPLAVETLDSLDSVLISAIVELEQLSHEELSIDALEARIREIWQHSYAFYANRQQAELETFFTHRGKALKTRIYPESTQRRRLYKTSLPPRSGNQLLSVYDEIKQHLQTGDSYYAWETNQRINFIQNLVTLLSLIQSFRPKADSLDWQQVLHWWLDPSSAEVSPNAKQISKWHRYVSHNFTYRINWGLGSVLSLVIDETFHGELIEISLEDWHRTGLPWIVFWLKELIVWGTLNPVAAYLLAKGFATTRAEASRLSETYYLRYEDLGPNEVLNASIIREWSDAAFADPTRSLPINRPASRNEVELLRDFPEEASQQWKVIPVEVSEELYWYDPAGFQLAKCQKPATWETSFLNEYDFILDSANRVVLSEIYV